MNAALLAILSAHVSAFALCAARISGFVVASPFPGENVGATQRAGLVVALSLSAAAFAPAGAAPSELGARLAVAALAEVACGVVIGLAVRFVMSAAEVLGALAAQATALSTPSVLNPTIESHDSPLARAVGLVAMLLALAAGAHRVALSYLLASFRSLPVGAPISFAPTASQAVDLAGAALAVGLRLAMPIVAVSLVVQLALAMIARAAPSLQVFNIGLTVMLGAGALTLVASMEDVAHGLLAQLDTLPSHLDALLAALASRAP